MLPLESVAKPDPSRLTTAWLPAKDNLAHSWAEDGNMAIRYAWIGVTSFMMLLLVGCVRVFGPSYSDEREIELGGVIGYGMGVWLADAIPGGCGELRF